MKAILNSVLGNQDIGQKVIKSFISCKNRPFIIYCVEMLYKTLLLTNVSKKQPTFEILSSITNLNINEFKKFKNKSNGKFKS